MGGYPSYCIPEWYEAKGTTLKECGSHNLGVTRVTYLDRIAQQSLSVGGAPGAGKAGRV